MKGAIKKYTAKNGKVSWRVTYDLPPDPVTGKCRQKRETAPTRKEAEALLTKALHALQSGAYIEASTATVGEWLPQWLDMAAPTVRPTTRHTYETLIELHIVPTLGTIPLAKLTPAHVQAFYGERLAAKLSSTTVRMLHAVLRRALARAVKLRLMVRNPCEDVDVPQPAKAEMMTWTAEQARAFLAGTAGDDLAALWRLALSTGMRQGEMLALRWQDIDLDHGALAVRRTLTKDRDGRAAIGEPKSAAGRRSIALDSATVAALRRHKASQNARRLQWGEAWQDAGLVFDRGDGVLLHHCVARDSFRRAAKRLGLPPIRFHDMRHTAATLMLAGGVHPKIVQERLGHSNVAMTLDLYSHVSMDMQRDAAERLERALGG